MKELLLKLRILMRLGMLKIWRDPKSLLTLLMTLIFLLWVRYWWQCTNECFEVFTEIISEMGSSTIEGEQYDWGLQRLIHRTLGIHVSLDRTLLLDRVNSKTSLNWYCNDYFYSHIKYVLTSSLHCKAHGINTYKISLVDVISCVTYRTLLRIPVGFRRGDDVSFIDYSFGWPSQLGLDKILQRMIYTETVDEWDIIKTGANEAHVLVCYTMLEDILKDVHKNKKN